MANEQADNKRALTMWSDFITKWPIDSVKNMSIEQYTALADETNHKYSNETFSWHLNSINSGDCPLGSSGTRFPDQYGIKALPNGQYQSFGAYKQNQDGITLNATESFMEIRRDIVDIISAAANHANEDLAQYLSGIESVALRFPPALKWKLAFLYQFGCDPLSINVDYGWKIYPVFDEKWAKPLSFNKSCQNMAEYQAAIGARKKNDVGCYAFYQQLLIEKDLMDLIKNNGQIILHGAPGTGRLIWREGILAPMLTNGVEGSEIKTVQFHPGYDYSDFVVGLKPKLINGQVSFEWRSGVFKEICDKAKEELVKYVDKNKAENKLTAPGFLFDPPKFVLIIDEINRADLSNVFGEAFSQIERSYRYRYDRRNNKYENELGICLPSTKEENGRIVNEQLCVPENLYIIGTMNDIDRSVESMDFALRRRFAWREIEAKTSRGAILDKFNLVDQQKLLRAMTKLNEWITKDPENKLGKAYELGASIFAQLELYLESGLEKAPPQKYLQQADDDAYESLWENHIKIILTEYLRGQDFDGDKIKNLKKAYLSAINGQDKDENGGRTSKKSKKEKASSDYDDGKGSDEGDKQVK